ncbi:MULTISPECIES: hypothetical protein [Brevibacterium]|uniref:YCII-related domain-containing protein n=1 Tax=Brevibacterium antiquum CNRZ 918 TaxID=1255637 RepID=A0A2H1IXD4_9MICO|nr:MULTISPECIES: hypothetical protein [Brevibacterium]SMX79863.1 hypothetical protein BANT918_01179 [Brevibacterium antiquum CNRZ 918]HCG56454.1 hypothetical protein [Brevibacterium sp.]
MKFMLIMCTVDQAAVDASEDVDFNEIVAAMGTDAESMINAGGMADGAGLSDRGPNGETLIIDHTVDPRFVPRGCSRLH